MKKEDVQCSITGNSTNPVRFQHLVAGTYKKWAIENGKKYFSVASGGGTGTHNVAACRKLRPDRRLVSSPETDKFLNLQTSEASARHPGRQVFPSEIVTLYIPGRCQEFHHNIHKKRIFFPGHRHPRKNTNADGIQCSLCLWFLTALELVDAQCRVHTILCMRRTIRAYC